jgi:predicted SAM-dependent methyltransferase
MQCLRDLIKRIKKINFRRKIAAVNKVMLTVGAGSTNYPGWISVDKDALDITKKEDFSQTFRKNQIFKILAEHVIEHIERKDFENFLYSVREYLDTFGTIRVAVPDAYHPSGYVKELTKPGGTEPGADDHKVFYTINMMQEIANANGYNLAPIEYFDDAGIFHSNGLDFVNGYISRCSANYKGRFTSDAAEFDRMISSVPEHLRHQFIDQGFSYTSLLVDFYKAE